MSFFKVTCPWCGTEYTTGIVGRQPVGSGHRCRAEIECVDCDAPARFAVRANDRDCESGLTDGDRLLVCAKHTAGRVMFMAQPRGGAY